MSHLWLPAALASIDQARDSLVISPLAERPSDRLCDLATEVLLVAAALALPEPQVLPIKSGLCVEWHRPQHRASLYLANEANDPDDVAFWVACWSQDNCSLSWGHRAGWPEPSRAAVAAFLRGASCGELQRLLAPLPTCVAGY